jgi:hypothetical protein
MENTQEHKQQITNAINLLDQITSNMHTTYEECDLYIFIIRSIIEVSENPNIELVKIEDALKGFNRLVGDIKKNVSGKRNFHLQFKQKISILKAYLTNRKQEEVMRAKKDPSPAAGETESQS